MSYGEKFQIIYVGRYSALKEVEHRTDPLRVNCTLWLPSKEDCVESGKKKTLQWRNLTTHLRQAIKVSINRDKSHGQHVPLIQCDENGALPLWSSHSKQATSGQSWEEIPIDGCATDTWPALKMVKVIKNKESLRRCCSREEPRWLNVNSYPRGNPGIEKGY